MKRLDFKPVSGLQIVCNKCCRAIHKSIEPYRGCKHLLESQAYKIVLPDPFNPCKRRTKNLTTKNLYEAIIALVQFKEELNTPAKIIEKVHEVNRIPIDVTVPEKTKSILLLECFKMYIDNKNNINVPIHKQRIVTNNYLKEIINSFEKFVRYLKSVGINVAKFEIIDIDDNIVGGYFKYLSDFNYAAVTFNTHISNMKIFFNFLNTRGTSLSNPFEGVRRKPVRNNPQTITAKDFYDLINIITPIDSKIVIGQKRLELKEYYREWLPNYIKLAAFTGRRRTEITQMKWSNIVCDEFGYPAYIESPDIKVNKLQNNDDKSNWKLIYVPIIEELRELLVELGYDQNKGKDEYLIAANEPIGRKSIEDFVSRSFNFFFKKLGRDYERHYKCLRKTYITRLEHETSGIARLITQHSSQLVIEGHYKDHRYIATQLSKSSFRVFEKKI